LERGDLDGLIGPRAPSCFERGSPLVNWLFPDPARTAADYFRRTGIFPIMHLVGVRRELAEQHPWLPMAIYKAFCESKRIALAALVDTSATKVTLPFVDEQLRAARTLMGSDFWSYGYAPNRNTLESFLHHHRAQGLSRRRLAVEELFHASTLEEHKI
jgi:4,5-dihydroxyphthalate decarboxylase